LAGAARGPGTKKFYRLQGWVQVGKHTDKETKFEMNYQNMGKIKKTGLEIC